MKSGCHRAAVLVILAVLIAGACASPARADTFWPRLDPGPDRVNQSYGLQIFGSDMVGLGLAYVAFAVNKSEVEPLLVGTAILWGVGGPAIHALHHQPRRALTSLGLRWGLSFGLGALLFAITDDHPCRGDCYLYIDDRLVYGGIGFLIGGASAQAIDWFVLARREVPARAETTAVTLIPVRGGLGLGLGGSF